MTNTRKLDLEAKLEKGLRKTLETMEALAPDQWSATLYDGPPAWTARDLLSHFVSSETALLHLARDVAGGGPGMETGFDFDEFNCQEQARLAHRSPPELLEDLKAGRRATLDWLRDLADDDLERTGRHPVLAETSVEGMVLAIYGHQLLHMRDLQRALGHSGA